MKAFAVELAAFLKRHYPEVREDGWYRFSADLMLRDGMVDIKIPLLSKLPEGSSPGWAIDRE
jgi:hypothetical protein